jgi:hypothetical protein
MSAFLIENLNGVNYVMEACERLIIENRVEKHFGKFNWGTLYGNGYSSTYQFIHLIQLAYMVAAERASLGAGTDENLRRQSYEEILQRMRIAKQTGDIGYQAFMMREYLEYVSNEGSLKK